jgi:NAD(P)-dependent dehydrogenase (short-subunit alcohol dehydrogenase family)
MYHPRMSLLSHQVAVVTGAANGIGRAVSSLFAEHGAKLVLSDNGSNLTGTQTDASSLSQWAHDLRQRGAPVLEHSADLRTAAGVNSLMDLVRREHGRIDVLVNCAGILRDRALLNLLDDDIEAVLELHVLGALRLIRAAAGMMRETGGGRIINTTSQQAFFGATGQCANSIAAAGLIGLTRSAAAELLRHRIYVNAVAPLARTRQTDHLPLFQKAKGMTPDHVAPAYLFLGCSLAGELSGETLTISGSKLSRLVIHEAQGAFCESDDGRFDALAIAEAWQKVQN